MTSRPVAILIAIIGALFLAACGSNEEASGPVVLAPSSMHEAIAEAAATFASEGHPAPVVSFAGTPSLARQVLADAPADLFISADEDWMDRVEKARKIVPGSRADLAGNGVVLVASRDHAAPVALTREGLARALGQGPLAMADPESVPAGRYGKASLEHLGLWPPPAPVSSSENVRAALALVEHGQAPLGQVYSSDAKASSEVEVVANLPADSHPPIRYPLALIAGSHNPQAAAFRTFLLSHEGQAILRKHGFTAP